MCRRGSRAAPCPCRTIPRTSDYPFRGRSPPPLRRVALRLQDRPQVHGGRACCGFLRVSAVAVLADVAIVMMAHTTRADAPAANGIIETAAADAVGDGAVPTAVGARTGTPVLPRGSIFARHHDVVASLV